MQLALRCDILRFVKRFIGRSGAVWLFVLLSFIIFFSAESAFGQVTSPRRPGGVTVGGPITLINPLGCPDLGCVAQAIINALFWISIPIVSIMVLIGGFQILFAAGNEERLKNGRNTILYAVAGFAIIIIGLGAVQLIRNFIGP